MTEQPTYLEILGVIQQGKKKHWNRIGTAFPTKDGTGYRLILDYMPTNSGTDIVLFPPKTKEGGEGQ